MIILSLTVRRFLGKSATSVKKLKSSPILKNLSSELQLHEEKWGREGYLGKPKPKRKNIKSLINPR
jgi:hypothetical protein